MKTAIALTLFVFFAGAQLGHLVHSDHEFMRAYAEWNAAHHKGDANAEDAAYHKEEIAHCKTIDSLWFLHGDHFCADARHP